VTLDSLLTERVPKGVPHPPHSTQIQPVHCPALEIIFLVQFRLKINTFQTTVGSLCQKRGRPVFLPAGPVVVAVRTQRSASLLNMGVWQGVAMDSLKYHSGPQCPTLLCPAGGPYSRFKGGPPTRRTTCSRLLLPWTPHAMRLCCAMPFSFFVGDFSCQSLT
jgi:hypothetical protein